MPARYFMAIIEAGNAGYGVTFPDLPGCVSAGDTIEAAARNAEEALALHLRGMLEDGELIPPATVPHRSSLIPRFVRWRDSSCAVNCRHPRVIDRPGRSPTRKLRDPIRRPPLPTFRRS
jgi:predicted RNase H-like HicB family nuclease